MQNEQQRDVESEREKQRKEEISAEDVVRYYKFFKQEVNKLVEIKLPLLQIPYKSEYTAHKKIYDKLTVIFNKYGINYVKYIKFCVKRLNPTNWKITPEELLNSENFVKFASYLKLKEQYMSIYRIYMKNVDFIAKECIMRRTTPKEYIKGLILENKLGYEYMSGRISKYFLSTIQNFRKIYFKLDDMNRDELSIIYNNVEILNQSVQEAFLMYRNRTIKPIELIKDRINQIIYNS